MEIKCDTLLFPPNPGSLLAYLSKEPPRVEGGGGAAEHLPKELVQRQGQLAWGPLHLQAQGLLWPAEVG